MHRHFCSWVQFSAPLSSSRLFREQLPPSSVAPSTSGSWQAEAQRWFFFLCDLWYSDRASRCYGADNCIGNVCSVGVGLLNVSVPLPSVSFFLFFRVSQPFRVCCFWLLRCLCGVSKIELRAETLKREDMRKRKRFWPVVVEGWWTCRVSCRGPRPTL